MTLASCVLHFGGSDLTQLMHECENGTANHTRKCNLKDPCNNIIHRPEEAFDIQSELTFVNGMVHLN